VGGDRNYYFINYFNLKQMKIREPITLSSTPNNFSKSCKDNSYNYLYLS